jgi:hypothetical protein
MKDLTEFTQYCWQCYGPHEIFGEFFNHTLTMPELVIAVQVRAGSPMFEGDSFDREAVRDLLLIMRGGQAYGIG